MAKWPIAVVLLAMLAASCISLLANAESVSDSLSSGKYIAPANAEPIVTPRSCVLDYGRKGTAFKVLLFVDACYFSLLHNWKAHYTAVCGSDKIKHLEVVCMDGDVEPMLLDIGLSCSNASFVVPSTVKSYELKQAIIWNRRLEIVERFLNNGYDLVLSDSDAIWLKDPFVQLNRHAQTSEIISSRGNFPFLAMEKWGATLCMGFIYFRSSYFTVVLLKSVREEMLRRADDQHSINTVLDRWGLTFDEHPLEMEFNAKTDVGHIRILSHNYDITLLPHTEFVRNCTKHNKSISEMLNIATTHIARYAVSTATVAHCIFSAGNAYAKFRALTAYHLWHTGVPNITKGAIVADQGCIKSPRGYHDNPFNLTSKYLRGRGPIRTHLRPKQEYLV